MTNWYWTFPEVFPVFVLLALMALTLTPHAFVVLWLGRGNRRSALVPKHWSRLLAVAVTGLFCGSFACWIISRFLHHYLPPFDTGVTINDPVVYDQTYWLLLVWGGTLISAWAYTTCAAITATKVSRIMATPVRWQQPGGLLGIYLGRRH